MVLLNEKLLRQIQRGQIKVLTKQLIVYVEHYVRRARAAR